MNADDFRVGVFHGDEDIVSVMVAPPAISGADPG
jgi:hypothetical protein